MSDNDLIPMEDDDTPGVPDLPTEAAPAATLWVETTDDAPAEPAPEPPVEQQEDPHIRGLKAELSNLRREAKQYKEVAQAADYLRDQLQGRPDIVEALRTGRPLTNAQERVVQQAQQAQPAARSAVETQQLTEYAETLSLYTPEGKPDVAAAARVMGFHRAESERMANEAAERAVGPFKAQRVSEQAQRMRTEAATAGQQMGLDPELTAPIIDQLIGGNPEHGSNPEVMSTALLVAAGMQFLRDRQAAPAAVPASAAAAMPSPPVFREGGTGRGNAPTMSKLEQTIAKQIGAKPAAWMETIGKLSDITEKTKHIVMEAD